MDTDNQTQSGADIEAVTNGMTVGASVVATVVASSQNEDGSWELECTVDGAPKKTNCIVSGYVLEKDNQVTLTYKAEGEPMLAEPFVPKADDTASTDETAAA